jgi:hypothetical protein
MHVDVSFSYLRAAATASFDKKEFHRNCTEAEVRFSPRLVLDGNFLGGGICPVEGGSGSLPGMP